MSKPDGSGEILRAIARSYRDELGPARAEQLVSRAMARAVAPTSRFPMMARLAAAAALGVSVLAVGVVLLVGDDSSVSDPEPAVPVAAAPPQTQTVEVDTSPAVSIPTHELEAALALIDQQRELEAAEVVVRALSTLVTLQVSDQEANQPPPTPPDEGNAGQTPPSTTSVTEAVPPEQNTLQQADQPPEDEEPPPSQTAPTETEPNGEEDEPQTPPTTQAQITIEDLGQALKVEVEELLSADPDDLAEAAEEARNAATPILEYGQEPSILLPPDE